MSTVTGRGPLGIGGPAWQHRGVIPPIVDPAELASLPDPVVLADVRWYLDGRPGRPAYEAGHLPGAVFVPLDEALAAHGRAATEGRHPLPAPEAFAAAMGALGIGADATVVAYDDSGGGTAGRLVWMLRSLGVRAALLDGGLATWDGPIETGPGTPLPPTEFPVRPWPADRFATVDEVAAAGADSATDAPLVLDARAADRYRGETEPIDPRAGHVPGARNAPWTGNLGPDGRFAPPTVLRDRFAGLGARDDREIVCYCGSGVSACADLLALERAGFARLRLFVGSWSGWSSDPERPVATGSE